MVFRHPDQRPGALGLLTSRSGADHSVRALILTLVLALAASGCGDFTVYRLEVSNESDAAVIVAALRQVGPLDPSLGRVYVIQPKTQAWTPDVVVGPMSPTNNRATVYVLDAACTIMWEQDIDPDDYALIIGQGGITIGGRQGPPPTDSFAVLDPSSICGFAVE